MNMKTKIKEQLELSDFELDFLQDLLEGGPWSMEEIGENLIDTERDLESVLDSLETKRMVGTIWEDDEQKYMVSNRFYGINELLKKEEKTEE